MRFLNEHPNWPRHDALTIRAEKTMPADLDPRDVVELVWESLAAFGDRNDPARRGLDGDR